MGINILDITQTILGGYFTMMIVDLSGCEASFVETDRALQAVARNLGMAIQLQRMDIFDAMHRV